MELHDYLRHAKEQNASDIYFLPGAPTCVKINGMLTPIESSSLTPEKVKALAYGIMTDAQVKEFEEFPELNLSYADDGLGRFRVNVYKQRNHLAMVVRTIQTDIPSIKSLGLPDVLAKLIMKKRGLLLFVGATGVGKSTSLAALINHRNLNSKGHIITIEDPIEFMHQHQQCIVTQREVGVDTDSYSVALKNTLRQAPDVILIGEVRAQETMEHAIAFSETGHLCLSTLHANNANQALERILHFFPKNQHDQLLLDLSLNLAGIVSQRLLHTKDNTRTAVFEILLGTPLVKDLIKRNEVAELKEIMRKSEHLGMQTFDSAILKKYKEGLITEEEALRNADSQNNLRLAISMSDKKEGNSNYDNNLSIVEDEDSYRRF